MFSYTPPPPVYLKHTQTHIRVTQTRSRSRWGRVKALKSQVDVSFYQKRTKNTHSQTQIHTHSNRRQTGAPFKARCQVNLCCVNRRGEKSCSLAKRKQQQEPVMAPLRSPHRPAPTCSLCLHSYMITPNTARLQHHRYCEREGWD